MWGRIGVILGAIAVVVAVVLAYSYFYAANSTPATTVPTNFLTATRLFSPVAHNGYLYYNPSAAPEMQVTLHVNGSPVDVSCSNPSAKGAGRPVIDGIEALATQGQGSVVSLCWWQYNDHLKGWRAYRSLFEAQGKPMLRLPMLFAGDERYLARFSAGINGGAPGYIGTLRHSETVVQIRLQSQHPSLSDVRMLLNKLELKLHGKP